ncbi:MAG: GEVED domain-containing protein [Flavobacteriales bacterium]
MAARTAVWIDFNANGLFETPAERVGFTTTAIAANGTGSFTLSLPCDPVPGVKRMRIRDVFSQVGNTIDPCANYGYGETEDYDVTIAPPPPCPAPSGLTASNITLTSVNLNWAIGCSESAWEVEYGATGFTVGTGTTVPAGTNPFTLGGLSAGTTYDIYLRADCGVDGVSTSFGPISVTTLPPPPANDDCGGAIALTVNADYQCGTVTAGTTIGATASQQPDVDSGTPDDDVWFSFVATSTTHRVSLLNVSNFTDMGHSVYRALPDPCAAAGMTLVLTSDADVSNPAGLTIGETYFVRVYAWGTGASNVNFNVCIGTQPPPPANDLCANAIAVSCNSVTNATTANSTTTGAPGTCSGYSMNTAGGIWYTVQGFNGTMTVDLSGSNFDTRLGIYTGSCGSLVCVAGDDDSGTGTTSLVTWTGSASQTYYLYVTGFSTNTGSVVMTVTCGDNNPVCPANGLTVEFQTDGLPFETTWEIRNGAGNVVASSGGPLVAPNGIQTESACLPDGCYTLRVLDAGGDGMTTGGYILRTQGTNERIIDNRNNFSGGSVSAISGGQGFCLPMSNDKLVFTSCDKLDWVSGQYVVAAPNAAVSAEWIPNAANNLQDNNSGYEFWIFDPNGSYSFRRFRSHNVSDGFGPASATRACHMKLNNWALASQVPANVLMNVRVRARVNGVNGEFGPACRLEVNPVLAACPQTNLMDIPDNQYLSCGATRQWGIGNYVHARPVAGANRYQFRFRIPAEGFSVVRQTTTYFVQLNWPTLPLQDGKTYDVDVRVSKDGGATWCSTSDPWGKVCQLTIGTNSNMMTTMV